MTIRKGSIVVYRDCQEWDGPNFRVVDIDGPKVWLRDLSTYLLLEEDSEKMKVRYQTDSFDPGDTVRVRKEYRDKYNEVDGQNELTVVAQFEGNVPTSTVRNNNGEQFNILNERLCLDRPAKSFKTGDRVVVDLELAEKYGNDGIAHFWQNAGVLVLTEDSGSHLIPTTSHVRYENGSTLTNNVPTRWLKRYEAPTKRVVGETIKVEDLKVGDKISVSQTIAGIHHVMTGVVGDKEKSFGSISPTIVSEGGGVFAYESRGAVYTLLEEAPEPVDENLQRLLDAEVGDIAHGTYAGDYYWKKVGEDEWKMLDDRHIYDTQAVFEELFKVKYGTLEFYRKVEDAD